MLINLLELRERVFTINVANGWHIEGKKRDFIDDINLIHSEISEAYEDYRNGHTVNEIWYEYKVKEMTDILSKETYTSQNVQEYSYIQDKLVLGKPCGIPSELADVIIRILDTDKLHELFIVDYYKALYEGKESMFSYSFNELIYSLHRVISEGSEEIYKELAFAIHLIVIFCKDNHINLDEIIEQKLAYNATRRERHGGKVI